MIFPKYWRRTLLILCGSFLSMGLSHAAIEGFNATIDGNYINLSWTPVPSDTQFEGYAVQWSKTSDSVKNTNHSNLQEDRTPTAQLWWKGTFNFEETYYIRVYTYTQDVNKKYHLANGSSKMIKFSIDRDGTFGTDEDLAGAADAITTIDTSAISSGSSSVNFKFPTPSVSSYDTVAIFSWSQNRKLTKSDFDKIRLEVSSDAAFPSSNTTKLDIPRNTNKARVNGLPASTNLYGRMSYVKNGIAFGTSATKGFKTINLVPSSGSKRRNLNRILNKTKGYVSIDHGESSLSTPSSTSSTSSSLSASTTTSSTTTVKPAPKAISSNASKDAKRAKIKELEAYISELKKKIVNTQSELARLRKEVGGTTSLLKKPVIKKSPSQSFSSRAEKLKALRANRARLLQKYKK